MEFNYPQNYYPEYKPYRNQNNQPSQPNPQNKKNWKFNNKFSKNVHSRHPQEKPAINLDLFINPRMLENPWKDLKIDMKYF